MANPEKAPDQVAALLPPVCTTTDLAMLLGVSVKTVLDWAGSGALQGFRTGGESGRWRFTREDVSAFLAGLRAESTGNGDAPTD